MQRNHCHNNIKVCQNLDEDHETCVLGMCYAGTNIFHWFTPAKLNEHRMYFTSAATVAACVVFYFMAGASPLFYLQTVADPVAAACMDLPGNDALSPTALTRWMTAKVDHTRHAANVNTPPSPDEGL